MLSTLIIYLNKTPEMKKFLELLKTFLLVLPGFISLQGSCQTNSKENKDWVLKSNQYTRIFIDIDQKYSPEFGSEQGVAFYDTSIAIPTQSNLLAKRKEM